jgi:steroid delta-isomerase-like uncharacterized protein
MKTTTIVSSVVAGTLAFTLAGCAAEPRPEPRVEPTGAPICAQQKSDAESNKAAVLRLHAELWDKRNPDAAVTSGVLASDVVNHAAIPEAQGAEGMRTITRKLFTAFPDLKQTVVDMTAEGDRVVLRSIMEGTQTAALEFKTPIPATGKHVRVEEVHIMRFKDGKVVEMWMSMDHMDLLKQLGVLPMPKKDGAP